VIGVALARIPKWLAQAVLVGLTVAAVGPLLKNFARPMVDPTFPFDTYLDGYYAGGAAAIGAPLEEFDDVARRLADSDCRTLGITNWVAIEYPLWVALDHHGWDGHIEQLNVANASSQLIPTDFEPCATLRQEADPATDVPQIHLVLELEDDRR
jgi:hypothetical protein